METADSCRRVAAEAVADVEPPQLHDLIETTLDEASMVPGVLTIESAAAMAPDRRSVLEYESDGNRERAAEIDRGPDSGDPETDTGGIATQAAGVQLIYEGLRLTRSLAHEEPWADLEAERGDLENGERGDLEILAADILVARGFYLLARTDAAGKAVRTVQAFGRDQTRRDAIADDESATDGDAGVDPASIDANLERDILELAVRTGAAASGDSPPPRLLATADAIADAVGPSFPPAAECLADLEPSLWDRALEDHTTDRATSATDP
ncbi:DUF7114 family protein [Haloterrigena alkaliphila]|uniref:Uncharacterized protein n=1 Tax=Haloterrigena alkaliphila TaxID=2816475 RepID=A0A8A2VG77_9EURY|nr:hypothetical protein [Haloterrigena alkaliphila]QSX01060.1 hypothetical protein J0X25_08940 [Haloterrigena alkaliphila]